MISKSKPWVIQGSNGKPTVNTHILYMELLKRWSPIVTHDNAIYIYDEREGIYHRKVENELKGFIKEELPIEFRTAGMWNSVYQELITSPITVSPSIFNNNERLIGFQNGVLNLDTMRLGAYSPELMLTRKIPCKYIENVTLDDAPTFKSFLYDTFGDDDSIKRVILEYLGAIISNVKGYRFKKMMLLIGPGNTGKTVLRNLIISIIGSENSMTLDFKEINSRFGPAALLHKRLGGCGDMAYIEVSEIDIIKQLTGGDCIGAQKKFGNHFQFVFDGFLLFTGNQLPSFGGDQGEHVYERFLIVPCNNIVSPEKRDPTLKDKLLNEMDIIASVAVGYLKKAVEENYKFSETKQMLKAREDYFIQNNSILEFMGEYGIPNEGRTKRSDFNREYHSWCIMNNKKQTPAKDIPILLLKHFNVSLLKSSDYYYELLLRSDLNEE